MPATTEHFSSGGDPVPAEVFTPKASGRRPAVLILHGLAGLAPIYRADIVSFAEALVKEQMVAVIPHYLEEVDTSVGMQSGAAMLDKLPALRARCADALLFMRSQSRVDAARLGAIGFSLGGNLAMDLGMSPPAGISLKAVVDFFGPTTFPPLHGNRAALPPVLIHHGKLDETVPYEDSENLVNELRGLGRTDGLGYEFLKYPKQGHGFTGSDLVKSRAKTVEFLKSIL